MCRGYIYVLDENMAVQWDGGNFLEVVEWINELEIKVNKGSNGSESEWKMVSNQLGSSIRPTRPTRPT